jgi:WD40 repeat protein
LRTPSRSRRGAGCRSRRQVEAPRWTDRTVRGHDAALLSAAFSPDGQRIVSASSDKAVRVWRADGSGELLVLRGHDDRVSGAEFSPAGRYIVSASKDKTIRIWRADGTGQPVILAGHERRLLQSAQP